MIGKRAFLCHLTTSCAAFLFCVANSPAQTNREPASKYFGEARSLCSRDNGALWNILLCGPMIFVDPVSHEHFANRDLPSTPPALTLGYANSAVEWGDIRWATIVWQMVPQNHSVPSLLVQTRPNARVAVISVLHRHSELRLDTMKQLMNLSVTSGKDFS